MGANFSKPKNIKKTTTQPQKQGMTKKQRKATMWQEVGRLEKAIPYMWTVFAQQIALHNMDHPQQRITDAFLLKVIEQGEKMDVWGKDAYESANLQTNNSTTNFNNLRTLMGEKLLNEVLGCGVSWGYFASLYDSIYRKNLGF